MELHEIEALTLAGAKTQSVPVPEELDRDIAANPEAYGLPKGTSARKARALLLLRGARGAKIEQREAARAEMYARMTADPEWQEAREETRAEAAEEGRF